MAEQSFLPEKIIESGIMALESAGRHLRLTCSADGICKNCQRKNFNSAKFCGSCGTLLEPAADGSSTLRNGVFVVPMLIIVVGAILSTLVIRFEREATNSDPVKWRDFKRFVELRTRISGEEIDRVAGEIYGDAVSNESNVRFEFAVTLESELRKALRQPRLSIFPNRFFGVPVNVVSEGKIAASQIVFTDIPLDHPVYQIVRPLLELGVGFWDDDCQIGLYYPMTGSSWNTIVSRLMEVTAAGIKVEGHLIPEVNGVYVGWSDLETFLSRFSEVLGLNQPDYRPEERSDEHPSRLEILFEISRLIRELEDFENS